MNILKIFFLLVAALLFGLPAFCQSDSASVSAIFEKWDSSGIASKQIVIRIEMVNKKSRPLWFVIFRSYKGGLSTEKMEMYRICGNGCAAYYNFIRENGFQAFLLQPHSIQVVDSFTVNCKYFKRRPKALGGLVAENPIVGDNDLANDWVKNDPKSDKDAEVLFSRRQKVYAIHKVINCNYLSHKPPVAISWGGYINIDRINIAGQ